MAVSLVIGVAAGAGAAALGASALLIGGAFLVGAGLGKYIMDGMIPDVGGMEGSTQTIKEPAAPRPLIYGTVRTGGVIIFADTTGDDNKYLHMVVAFAGHEINDYRKIFVNEKLVWVDGAYQGDWNQYVDIRIHRGNETVADSVLVSRTTKWTNNHKLLDTAYIYVRLKYDAEELNSIPNISTIIEGKKVLNPATGVTAFSDNPALCLRDYLTDTKYGLGESASSIDADSLAFAVSKCDETVALDAGGNQKRYTCNGIMSSNKSRKANITNLLKCMGGQLTYSNKSYYMKPAVYVSPSSVTIDESNIVGAIKTRTKQSRRQLYNGVKGTYISAENNYIKSDYPAQISSTYAAADGDPIYMDLQLPFVTNNTQAQRLAKIALFESRQQTSVTIPCNLAALNFKAGDNVMVSNVKMGWSNKVFEVIDYQMSLSDAGQIIVNLELIETASEIYNWNASDEEDFFASGELDLYDGSTAQPPSSLTATTAISINEDGTAVEKLLISWGASADVYVERYEVEWATVNAPYQTAVTDGLRYEVQPVIAAATYYVRVRAVNNLGVKSSYVSANVTASGDETAPAAPASLTATPQANSVVLTWTNPSDADFSHMTVRQKQSGGSWATAASVSGGKGESETFTVGNVVGGTTYYYAIRSVDYSGNVSAYVYSSAVVPLSPETRAPRNAHGYVYFKTASANPPSLPSATSYNYDSNAIGGLTSTWQQDPLTVTGGDGKYWASAYIVTESVYDGNETIAFSEPFSNFNFDGLVTFTNLANTLADPNTTNITTIDGGLIKTGKVEADRIEVDGVGLDTQIIGGVQTLVIGSGGVTNANIANNTITASRIAANAINNSEINTDAVENYNIENGAVTNVKFSGALSSTDFVSGSAGWQVDKNGDAEFNDATFRGTLSAASGTLGTITLPSNGNIKAGQTSYHNGTGFYLGNDSGTPRFSIGNSSGNHMRWNGSNLYIVGAKKVVSAGDEVLAVSTKGGQTNTTTYVKVAEIAVGVDGAIRTKATIAGGNSSTTAYGQFRKNGSSSAYKSFSKSNTGYTEFVDSSENINPGDTLELWLKSNVNGRIAFWGSFGVYASDGSDAAVTLEV